MTKSTMIISTIGVVLTAGLVGYGAITKQDQPRETPEKHVKSASSQSSSSQSDSSQMDAQWQPSASSQASSQVDENKDEPKPIKQYDQPNAIFTGAHLLALSHQDNVARVVLEDKVGYGDEPISINVPTEVTYQTVGELIPSPTISGAMTYYKFANAKDADAFAENNKSDAKTTVTKIGNLKFVKFSGVTINLMPDDQAKYLANTPFTRGTTEVN